MFRLRMCSCLYKKASDWHLCFRLCKGIFPCSAVMRAKKSRKTAKHTFRQAGCSAIIYLYTYVFYGRGEETMLNVAVCDDSDAFLQEAEKVLRRDTRIGEIRLYHTPERLLEAVLERKTGTDLVLMDIEFEAKKNGLTAAEELCCAKPEIQIIYMTGYNDRYAQHVLLSRVNLVGYLTKPLDSDLLTCYLDKIYRMSSVKSFFTFSVRGQQISVLTETVLYLESRNHTVVIHTDDADYTVYEKLSSLSEQLPPVFVRCHKSYLVNMNRIQHLSGSEIRLSETHKAPISKRYQAQTREAFFRHIGQRL